MSPLILDYPTTCSARMARARAFSTTPAKVQDVRRLVDIEFSAFENEQVNQVLSFRDYKKPSHFKRSVGIYRKALNTETASCERNVQSWINGSTDSQVSIKKVVDTKTNEIVSFAKVERKAYSVEELHAPWDLGHEAEPIMNRDWFALNERLRREYVGLREHFYIGMLATEPRHQHHGAGTLLLEEILAEADDAGIEVYLEATDTAKPMYEKHGFETITELRFDPEQYGHKGLGVERQTVMVRGALGGSGNRHPVRSWDAAVARTRAQLREIDERTWEWSACR